jgi:hypothetical protein
MSAKRILFSATLCASLLSTTLLAKDSAAAGKTIEYSVAGYTIQAEFLSDKQLRWTYLKAPTPAEVGKTAIETTDNISLRRDLVLAAWTEASGANVVDVFDFGKRKVIANFVMPDGKRYQSVADFKIVKKK